MRRRRRLRRGIAPLSIAGDGERAERLDGALRSFGSGWRCRRVPRGGGINVVAIAAVLTSPLLDSLFLAEQIIDADVRICGLVRITPLSCSPPRDGIHCPARLLSTAGDHPDRLHSDAAFAALCGTSPVETSSGQHRRHRLNAAATASPTAPCGSSPTSGSSTPSHPRPSPNDAAQAGETRSPALLRPCERGH